MPEKSTARRRRARSIATSTSDVRARAPYVRKVKLSDVVDLEVQLALDDSQDEALLQQRDRALVRELSPVPTARDALLTAWLEKLRDKLGVPRAGERVAAAQRIVGYGLALLGLSMGWGVAEVLLRFEQGGAPVNVGYYLLVLVFGQLATLLLLLLGLVLRGRWPDLPLVGDVTRLLRFVARRLQGSLHDVQLVSRERAEADRAVYHRIRTRVGLY